MKKQIFLSCLLSLSVISCNGQDNTTKKDVRTLAYNGFDFTTHISNFSANENTDTTNIIDFGLPYHPDSSNHYALGHGFMIHQKGIKYWFDFAQKEYKKIGLSGKNYGYSNAAKMLAGKDRPLLKEFDKWIFVIDKKYLVKGIRYGEMDANDPNRDKPQPDVYDIKEGIDYEILLLEQKAGEKIWHIIDKFDYQANKSSVGVRDAKGDWHYPVSDWKGNFQNKKVKQYAKMK